MVWAEGSTGSTNADPVLVPEVAEAIGDEAERIGAYLLVGGDRVVSDTEWINANVLFDREGEIVGEYRKRQPVPFGEYVPWRSLLAPLIPELSQVPRDMIRGEDPVVFSTDFGMLGSVVSWEGSFARFPRDVARNGAQLLVVATNNASYEVSPASDQLIGMTRMRGAELGLDVVHAAVTGKSTLITDGGEVGERTPIYEPALLTGEVQMRDAGPTLYTRSETGYRWRRCWVWSLPCSVADPLRRSRPRRSVAPPHPSARGDRRFPSRSPPGGSPFPLPAAPQRVPSPLRGTDRCFRLPLPSSV